VVLWIGTTNTRHRDRLRSKQLDRIGEDKLVGDIVDAVHSTAISQYRQQPTLLMKKAQQGE
jgi:Mg-chelatase subunit ChlI